MVLSYLLFVAAIFSLIKASPINDTSRIVKIHGSPCSRLIPRADGSFDYELFKADILKTRSKYSIYTYNNGAKRQVAKEPLANLHQEGVDVEYYGPISIGTPGQIISENPSRSADQFVADLGVYFRCRL
jgi:hypothetical protein